MKPHFVLVLIACLGATLGGWITAIQMAMANPHEIVTLDIKMGLFALYLLTVITFMEVIIFFADWDEESMVELRKEAHWARKIR